MNLERLSPKMLTIQWPNGRKEELTNLKLAPLMTVSGLAGSEMGLESSSGQMAPGMKGIGKTIELTARANSLILTETFTMVIGSTIKLMGMVFTTILMVLCMRGNGGMTSSMARAKSLGPISLFTRESIWLGRSMEPVFTLGTMARGTKESGMKIRSKASELTVGSMVVSTRANGLIIIWMEWAFTLGPMAGATWVNTRTIKSMDTASTSGPMVDFTSVNGCEASNTALASTKPQKPHSNTVSGKMANV